MDINALVKITSRAWSLEILALLHTGTPGRQASLLSASGAGRTALTQSLHHLVELELLERNPGHGHPLRPEFRLTPSGVEAAKFSEKIKIVAPESSDRIIIRRNWTVPILAVSEHPSYFTDIKTRLGPITDRALSQSIKQLQLRHWLQRVVDPSITPTRPLYQAINAGAQISNAAKIELF